MVDYTGNIKEEIMRIYHSHETKLTVLMTVVFGLIAHGMAIFNKFSFQDDFMTRSSSGVPSGRWAGFVLDEILSEYWGESPSTPVFFGGLAIIFMALGAALIVQLFEIKKIINIVLISGLMVAFPALTTIYVYNFMIHTYTFSIFLVILGSYLVCKYKNVLIGVLASIFICFGIGIYQASIPVMLIIFLSYMLYEWIYAKEWKWKKFFCEGSYYIFVSIISLIVYIVIEKYLLYALDLTLTDYNGIDTMASDSILVYVERIFVAYRMFFSPEGGIVPLVNSRLYTVTIICIATVFIYIAIIVLKENLIKGIQCCILILILPIAIDFIYIMCGVENTYIYSAMMYALVTPFILLAVIGEKIEEKINISWLNKIARVGIIVLLSCVLITYLKFDNMCYTKALLLQEQCKSYFTVLRGRIEGMEDYSEEYQIAYINEFEKSSKNISQIAGFDLVNIEPYKLDTFINMYSWKEFMEYWCGYNPQIVDDISEYEQKPEVINMPTYPNAGSIKIIGDVIVVKF